MATRTFLYSFANLDVLSREDDGDDTKLVCVDERVNGLSLCWLALFRSDDLLEYPVTYQPLRELSGKNLDVIGPRPDPITEKRISPVASREKSLLQLEQAKGVLAETFPEHPNLPAWLDVMKRHLGKFPLPWLAIEWSELGESGDYFLNDMRWILEGWNDPTRTRSHTPQKTLWDFLFFRKPDVQVRSWKDELIECTGLELSLGIPAPGSSVSEEDADDSNANFFELHPSPEG